MRQPIPVLEEQLEVSKRKVETGRVRIGKTVVRRHENIDLSLLREDVEVRRVPVNRAVDRPVDTRVEDGTTIISLHEEVAVVTTQLMLVEELHVSLRKKNVHAPRKITLRRELPRIERAVKDSADNAPSEAAD